MQYISTKKLIAALMLTVMVLTCRFFMSSGMFHSMDAEGIKTYIASFGFWAPVIYMIMFSVIPSGSIIAIAGGMAFGLYYGTLYTLMGAVIGASVAFYISRHIGREAVEKRLHGKMKRFDTHMKNGGFLMILILRLIPVIPFNVVSYGAGLTKIKFFDYFYATLIGIIPGVLIFTNIGDKALDVRSPQFLTAMGLLAAMIAASLLLKRKYTFEDIQAFVLKRESKQSNQTRVEYLEK